MSRLHVVAALVCGLFLTVLGALPVTAAAETPPEFTVGVAVLDEGAPDGQPYQIVELTLGPGATLADASTTVFGDEGHVDEIFAAVQVADPSITSPAIVPAGLSFAIKIDPTTTYVLVHESVDETTGATVREFTNDVVERRWATPYRGVTRLTIFPAKSWTRLFVIVEGDQTVTVKPGGRMIDYVFGGESYQDLIGAGFAAVTPRAAVAFTEQTDWDPIVWPPTIGETRRVVLGPADEYARRESPPVELTASDKRGQAAQRALIEEQHRVGIYAERHEGLGTLYQVEVNDPATKASDVVRLLFGDPVEGAAGGEAVTEGVAGGGQVSPWRLLIAQQAGFALPVGEPGALADFDPSLFGRTFSVFVDAADERFVVDEKTGPDGERLTLLVNGTTIETRASPEGVQRIVRYSSGYKKVTYRPNKWTLLVADVLAFFRGGGIVLGGQGEVSSGRDLMVAEAVWKLAFDMPRDAGDLVDHLALEQTADGPLVRATVGPRVSRGRLTDLLLGLWERGPLLSAFGLTLAAAMLVLSVRLINARRDSYA